MKHGNYVKRAQREMRPVIVKPFTNVQFKTLPPPATLNSYAKAHSNTAPQQPPATVIGAHMCTSKGGNGIAMVS